MTLLEMFLKSVALLLKEICIFAPLSMVGIVVILIIMIVLKQGFGISTRKIVRNFMGGAF